ncbi:MAG: C40 family peptidase [Clostridiales Family XIII bacterium]|jgi:hypothetical protein|nr:C40 family peptidase [Clostridiales Family XIII bacterium]
MAAPAAAVAAKVAVEVARDKRLRTAVIAIALGGIFLLFAPVVLIMSIAEGGAEIDYGSTEVIAALAANMTDEQKEKMEYIDDVMKKLQAERDANAPDVDFIKIQVFYLCILYGKEKESDTFYEDFIGCFADAKDDGEVFSNIEDVFGVELTKEDRQDVAEFYAKSAERRGAMGDGDFNNLIAIAEAQLGKPYVFGAAGPDSFDCSGFVQYCFLHGLGKSVPRTAEAQQAACKAVKKSARKPGDLIFFQNTYKTGVSHVGIYIGENTMIHAPGSGDVVKYSKVTDRYYVKHFHSYGRFE